MISVNQIQLYKLSGLAKIIKNSLIKGNKYKFLIVKFLRF